MTKNGNLLFTSILATTFLSAFLISALLCSCWLQAHSFASIGPLQESSSTEPTYKASSRVNKIVEFSNDTYRVEIDEVNQLVNVTVFDYAYPPLPESPSRPSSPPEPFRTPVPKTLADNCGDGSNVFITNGDVRWMDFPVSYAVGSTDGDVSLALLQTQ